MPILAAVVGVRWNPGRGRWKMLELGALKPIVEATVDVFWEIASLPLHILTLDRSFAELVFYPGEGVATLKPWAVVCFWGAMAIMALTAIMAKWMHRARRLRT
jgi:hypothetical protein